LVFGVWVIHYAVFFLFIANIKLRTAKNILHLTITEISNLWLPPVAMVSTFKQQKN